MLQNIVSISLGAILINNFIFSQFLGCCPFLGCSNKVDTATGMGLAVVFVAGMDAGTEDYTMDVARCFYTVGKHVFVFSLTEPATFRVAGTLLDVFLFLLSGSFLF